MSGRDNVATDDESHFRPPYTPSDRVVVEWHPSAGRAPGVPPAFDLYRPHDDRRVGSRAGWVFVHGGGWRSGTRRQFRRQASAFAERQDAVALCVEYRLGPGSFPGAVEDIASAVRWLRANADRLGIGSGGPIGLVGGSAGGHLAALAATGRFGEPSDANRDVPSTVDALALFNPIVDLVAASTGRLGGPIAEFLGGPEDDLLELARAASPLVMVDAAHPPTLLQHGTADEVVPFAQAEAYRSALERVGVPVRLVSAAGAGHGYFNDEPGYRPGLEELLRFAADIGGG